LTFDFQKDFQNKPNACVALVQLIIAHLKKKRVL